MWRRIDHVLRFAYVLLCPLMIVALTGLIPVTGILVNATLATGVALAGSDRWNERMRRIPILGRPLANIGRLGTYYQTTPPKPLLYYVLYPLFAPYWLIKKSARTELLVYKKLGAVALVITLVTSAVDYAHAWYPMPGRYFFSAMFATTVLQLIFTFMFVMPIVTTVLVFHRAGHRKSLTVLGVLGIGFGVLMAIGMRTFDHVPFATQQRVISRMKWKPAETSAAIDRGLEAALAVLATRHDDVDAARDAARAALRPAFRADETHAFKIVKGQGVLLLWTPAKSKHRRIAWHARTATGPISSSDQLPPDVRKFVGLEAGLPPYP